MNSCQAGQQYIFHTKLKCKRTLSIIFRECKRMCRLLSHKPYASLNIIKVFKIRRFPCSLENMKTIKM